MPTPQLKSFLVVRPVTGPVTATIDIIIQARGSFIDGAGTLIFVDQPFPGNPGHSQVHAFAQGHWEEFHEVINP